MLTSFKKGKIKRGRTVVVSEKQAIPYSVKADVKEECRRAQQEEHKKEQKENEMMIYVMRQCCYQTICRRLTRKRL